MSTTRRGFLQGALGLASTLGLVYTNRQLSEEAPALPSPLAAAPAVGLSPGDPLVLQGSAHPKRQQDPTHVP